MWVWCNSEEAWSKCFLLLVMQLHRYRKQCYYSRLCIRLGRLHHWTWAQRESWVWPRPPISSSFKSFLLLSSSSSIQLCSIEESALTSNLKNSLAIRLSFCGRGSWAASSDAKGSSLCCSAMSPKDCCCVARLICSRRQTASEISSNLSSLNFASSLTLHGL